MGERQINVVGAYEIRRLLGGVSRQRAYQITTRPDFPKEVADLAQGKVWLFADVRRWIDVHRDQVTVDPVAGRSPAARRAASDRAPTKADRVADFLAPESSRSAVAAALAAARKAVRMLRERDEPVGYWLGGEISRRGLHERAALFAVLEQPGERDTIADVYRSEHPDRADDFDALLTFVLALEAEQAERIRRSKMPRQNNPAGQPEQHAEAEQAAEADEPGKAAAELETRRLVDEAAPDQDFWITEIHVQPKAQRRLPARA